MVIRKRDSQGITKRDTGHYNYQGQLSQLKGQSSQNVSLNGGSRTDKISLSVAEIPQKEAHHYIW